MLFASVALLAAAALACGANARQVSLPIIVNGTTQLGHHTTIALGFLGAIFPNGTVVTVTAPAACGIEACFTDVAPAYPDHTSWDDNSVCLGPGNFGAGEAVTFYPRPESIHIVLYQGFINNDDDGACPFEVLVQGNLCNSSWEFGPACESPTPLPSSFVLYPGQTVSFEGATNPNEVNLPKSNDIEFTYQYTNGYSNGPNAFIVAGRTFDHARIFDYSPQPLTNIVEEQVYNLLQVNETDLKRSSLEIDMPARLHVASAGQQRIPLFWTFAASPNNTDPITISITYSQEVECPIENYVGTLCEYFVPHIDNSFTYSAKFSESGNIAPVLDIQDQTSFVFGLGATTGTVYALLRYGNIPTPTNFDVKLPLTVAGQVSSTQAYYSDNIIDTKEAPWYVVFINPNDNVDTDYYYWLNTDCPSSCNGNGVCNYNAADASPVHTCTCNEGFPEPTCAVLDEAPTTVPELDRPMTSTSKFFIVYGTFAIVAVLGLWGFLHRRRTQLTQGYSNL